MAKRSPEKTLFDAFRESRNVMTAVILRDMRTRFFNHGLGFLIVSLWPLAHMVVLIVIYEFMGRAAPFGDSLRVFFATGLVPVLAFSYVSRFMAYSLNLNRPMLAFPVVKPLDILAARAILEILAAFITAGAMCLILLAGGDNPLPIDTLGAIGAYLSVLTLACGVGTVIGVVGMLWPPIITIYSLFIIVVYLTSGVLFVPSMLPEGIGSVLSYNPVLQSVEWLRTAYYPAYNSRLLDRSYVWEFSSICLLIGLFMERALRRIILE